MIFVIPLYRWDYNDGKSNIYQLASLDAARGPPLLKSKTAVCSVAPLPTQNDEVAESNRGKNIE